LTVPFIILTVALAFALHVPVSTIPAQTLDKFDLGQKISPVN